MKPLIVLVFAAAALTAFGSEAKKTPSAPKPKPASTPPNGSSEQMIKWLKGQLKPTVKKSGLVAR